MDEADLRRAFERCNQQDGCVTASEIRRRLQQMSLWDAVEALRGAPDLLTFDDLRQRCTPSEAPSPAAMTAEKSLTLLNMSMDTDDSFEEVTMGQGTAEVVEAVATPVKGPAAAPTMEAEVEPKVEPTAEDKAEKVAVALAAEAARRAAEEEKKMSEPAPDEAMAVESLESPGASRPTEDSARTAEPPREEDASSQGSSEGASLADLEAQDRLQQLAQSLASPPVMASVAPTMVMAAPQVVPPPQIVYLQSPPLTVPGPQVLHAVQQATLAASDAPKKSKRPSHRRSATATPLSLSPRSSASHRRARSELPAASEAAESAAPPIGAAEEKAEAESASRASLGSLDEGAGESSSSEEDDTPCAAQLLTGKLRLHGAVGDLLEAMLTRQAAAGRVGEQDAALVRQHAPRNCGGALRILWEGDLEKKGTSSLVGAYKPRYVVLYGTSRGVEGQLELRWYKRAVESAWGRVPVEERGSLPLRLVKSVEPVVGRGKKHTQFVLKMDVSRQENDRHAANAVDATPGLATVRTHGGKTAEAFVFRAPSGLQAKLWVTVLGGFLDDGGAVDV